MERKKIPITIAGLVGVSGALGFMMWGYDDTRNKDYLAKQERRDLYQAASRNIADLDGRPGTSHEDWATAYKEVLNFGFY